MPELPTFRSLDELLAEYGIAEARPGEIAARPATMRRPAAPRPQAPAPVLRQPAPVPRVGPPPPRQAQTPPPRRAQPPRHPTPAPRPHTPRRRFRIWHAAAGLSAVVLLVTVVAVLWLFAQAREVERTLPPVRMDLAAELPRMSYIYAADGTQLAEIGLENRTWADLSDISAHVVDALLATEDRRFFEHTGVDYQRLVSAGWAALRGSEAGGASTLTMQLVRNVYPEIGRLPRRDRKVRELLMAQKLEQVYTKRELLELYLNKMSFGRGAFGIEAAAETYFSKSAHDLEMLEAALLVGLLKGPSFYDPVQYPERARERRRVVLLSLAAWEKLTPGVADRLSGEPLGLRLAPRSILSDTAPHFAERVRREMEAWGVASGFDIYQDGLRIYTTLDPYLQRLAQNAVDTQLDRLQELAGQDWAAGSRPFAAFWAQNRQFEERLIQRTERFGHLRARGSLPGQASWELRNDPLFMDSLRTAVTRLESGLVALDPGTGEIRAWVGSRDFAIDQYDKVGAARRQPGSTFKPILYAAALEVGYTPHHLAEDVVQTYYPAPQYQPWRPTNAGGGATGMILTLRQSLAKSKNTVSARLVQEVGPTRLADMARRMGIQSDLLEVPSLALGTSEVTLLEMVSAYGTFVAEGMHFRPRTVLRIEDADGEVLADFGPVGERAMASQHAYTMLDMLGDVTRPGGTGSGLASRFHIPGEWTGKTGTTQENTDGWFIAMHPDLVMGSWVGFNLPAVRFRSDYHGQGAHNAGLVVGDFLEHTLADPMSGVGPARFRPPAGWITPQAPADPFAGNLVDPVRRAEYYGDPDPGLVLDPEAAQANPEAAQAGPQPATGRGSTRRAVRNRIVW